MERSASAGGLDLSPEEISQIRDLISANPDWSRCRLSRELAAAWGWRNPAGELRDMAVRNLLTKLDARGLIVLPASRPGPREAGPLRATRTVKKPKARASDEEKKAWKEMQKKKNLSTHFRRMVTGLRKALDDAGHAAKTLMAVVDGSYCSAVTFAASLGDRIALLARCRKDIRLCIAASTAGRSRSTTATKRTSSAQ